MPGQTPTPTRGVPLMLDKKRRLRFSLKTMRLLREEFGDKTLTTGLGQDSIGKFLWYGLKHEDPELTIDQVEEMIDLEQLTEVLEAIAKATGNRGKLEQLKVAVAAASDDVPPAGPPTDKETPALEVVEDKSPDSVAVVPPPPAAEEEVSDAGPPTDEQVAVAVEETAKTTT